MNRSDLMASGRQLLRQADIICTLYPDRPLMGAAVVSDAPGTDLFDDPRAGALQCALLRLRSVMLGVQAGGFRNLDRLRDDMCDVERLCELVRHCDDSDPHAQRAWCR
ncbi:hypothetical protein [Gemmata sp.]|uniref:hypothetical protein n=1 Tax=Gemmata sp. TaxID=1914242 RepID=UPI003F720AC0